MKHLLLPVLFAVCLPGWGQEAEEKTSVIKIFHPDGKDAESFVRSQHVAVGSIGEMHEKDGVLVCKLHHPHYNYQDGGAFIETFDIIKPTDDQVVAAFKEHCDVLLIKSMERPGHWLVAGLEVLSPKEPHEDKLGGWLPASFSDESMDDGLLASSKYRHEGFVDDKLEDLKSNDPEVRRRALYFLGVIEPDTTEAAQVIDKLVEFMNSKEISDRTAAMFAIGTIGGQHAERYVPRIAELLESKNPRDQYAAIDAICKIGGREAQKHIPRIIELMQIESGLAYSIVYSLGELGGQAASALPALLDGLKAVDKNDRRNVEVIIIALGRIGPSDPKVIDALTPLLDHESEQVRQLSKRALSGRDCTRPAPE